MPTDYAALIGRIDTWLAREWPDSTMTTPTTTQQAPDLLRDARTALRELQADLYEVDSYLGRRDALDGTRMQKLTALMSAARTNDPRGDLAKAVGRAEAAEARAERAEAQLAASDAAHAPRLETCPETDQGLAPLPHDYRCTMCGRSLHPAAPRPSPEPPQEQP